MTVAVSLLAGCSAGEGKKNKQQSAVAAEVLQLEPHPLVLDKHYPALLRSPQEVKVVARVNGFLEKRYYNEGAYVKKGQKLFTIEPAPYKAQVLQREANLASAKASKHKAALSWDRISTLYKRHAVSEQRRDNARANLATARASVKQAKAALEQAQINLNYTQVNAPVPGMISLRDVNVGNLVQSPQQLATITPLNPINARFSLPEPDAAALRAQHRSSGGPGVKAQLRTATGKTVLGKVDFLGSQVDRRTGTVQARATFKNPNHVFLPGQYVQIGLLHLRLPHVLAVPQVAVTEGQEGPQLYLLGENNKVKPKSVDLGTQTRNDWVIVTDGLKPGARLVVDHISKVEAGTPIEPKPVQADPNKPFDRDKAGSGQAGDSGGGAQAGTGG